MNRRPPPIAAAVLSSLAAWAACASPTGDGAAPRPPAPAPVVVDQPATEVAPEAAEPTAPPLTLEAPDGALDPLYRALAAAEAGAAGGRALIAQFGDSHTAGDRFTGRLRQVLQARFGDAGRGFVLPGKPAIKHYYVQDVRYGSDRSWRADQGGKRDTREPYGLAGVRSYARDRDRVAWVETCADCATGTAVGRFELFYLRQRGGGELELRVDDGAWRRLPTALGADDGDTEVAVPAYEVVEVPDGPHRLTLRPRGGKEVAVFGVAMERAAPGVVVDGLGIVGLQLAHLWRWDWTVVGPQLARRDPALVVLQYGTNEADDPDLDLPQLEARTTELVGRIKAAVPGAAILLLGPPDMGVRVDAAACKALEKKLARKRRRADVAALTAERDAACAWRTPAILHEIIAVQRRVAQATGVAFFDSLAAMGGPDRIDAMVTAEPALAYGDHVHFTGKGYAAWADLVVDDLLRGFEAWQARATRRVP